jgi:hypothetical protein
LTAVAPVRRALLAETRAEVTRRVAHLGAAVAATDLSVRRAALRDAAAERIPQPAVTVTMTVLCPAIAADLCLRPIAFLSGAKCVPATIAGAHLSASIAARARRVGRALALALTLGPRRPLAGGRIAAAGARPALSAAVGCRSGAFLVGASAAPLTVLSAQLGAALTARPRVVGSAHALVGARPEVGPLAGVLVAGARASAAHIAGLSRSAGAAAGPAARAPLTIGPT